MRRLLSIGLATFIAISVLGGCTNTNSSSSSDQGSTDSSSKTESSSESSTADISAPGVYPIVKDKQTFKVMTAQTTYITDMNTNDFYKWYEEKTNVKIEFDLVPESAMKEKVNLTLASNKLPDAFLACGIGSSDLIKYGEQGTFIPINDMVETHGSFIKEVFDENELLPESITAPNGSIYALPGINECYHCFYSGRSWINTEWLKNVGMEYPNTTDELYNVLKAFKEKDANGNGDPNDEIPMMGSDTGWNTRPYDFLLNSFVYNDTASRIAVTDGKINFVADTDEFKEGLKYIKKLIDEQLIDPVSLTQTEQQYAVIGGNPESIDVGVAVGACWWSGLGNDDSDPLQRARQYVGLSPLEGPKGVRNVLTSEGGIEIDKFAITNACKNPEVLFKWGEGQYDQYTGIVASFGTEGIDWEKPADGVKGINGLPALYKQIHLTSGTDTQNFAIPNFGIVNNTAEVRAGQAVEDEEEAKWGIESRLENETKTYFEPYRSNEAVPSILLSAEDSTERSRLQVQITDYVLENIVAFLSGAKDIDKDWDAYCKEFDVLEVAKYLEIVQKGYDNQYK